MSGAGAKARHSRAVPSLPTPHRLRRTRLGAVPQAQGCHLCTQPRRRVRTRRTPSPSLCRCSCWGCGSARARLPGTRLCWEGGRGSDGRVAGTPPLAHNWCRLVGRHPETGRAASPAQEGLAAAAAVGSTASLPQENMASGTGTRWISWRKQADTNIRNSSSTKDSHSGLFLPSLKAGAIHSSFCFSIHVVPTSCNLTRDIPSSVHKLTGCF